MLMSARIQITMRVETANHLRLATLKISKWEYQCWIYWIDEEWNRQRYENWESDWRSFSIVEVSWNFYNKWRWVEYQSRSYPSSSRYFSMISIQWFSSLILNICHQNLHWDRDLIRDHQYLTLSDSLLKKHWKILVTNCSLMISDISLISWASRNILFNGYIVSYFYYWFDLDLEQLDL